MFNNHNDFYLVIIDPRPQTWNVHFDAFCTPNTMFEEANTTQLRHFGLSIPRSTRSKTLVLLILSKVQVQKWGNQKALADPTGKKQATDISTKTPRVLRCGRIDL